MAEIIKTYRQSVGALRFIGKKYGDADRVDGCFSAQWGEWMSKGWFDVIERQSTRALKESDADGDAYIGLMRWKAEEPFEYWIGIFMPEDTPVPDGFAYKDFPKSELGVCWIYGKESEVYFREEECAGKLGENGYELAANEDGATWFFERYACPRFTTPDEKGNIILDICHFIK